MASSNELQQPPACVLYIGPRESPLHAKTPPRPGIGPTPGFRPNSPPLGFRSTSWIMPNRHNGQWRLIAPAFRPRTPSLPLRGGTKHKPPPPRKCEAGAFILYQHRVGTTPQTYFGSPSNGPVKRSWKPAKSCRSTSPSQLKSATTQFSSMGRIVTKSFNAPNGVMRHAGPMAAEAQ